MKKSTASVQPDRDLARARKAWAAGQTQECARLLDRHLNRYPDDVEAVHLRGSTALQSGMIEGAVSWLLRAVELQRDNADIWCDLGTALHTKGEMDEAQRAYIQALALDPTHADALFNLANVLRDRKQFQDALQFYTSLLAASPEYRNGWNNTGLALLEMSHLEEARKCFERELSIDAHNTKAILNLGYVHKELGHIDEAIHVYREGLSHAPRYADLHLNLGAALNAIGDTQGALSHLRQAVQLQPSNAAAHQSLIFTLDFDVRARTRDQQSARREWYRHCIKPLSAQPLESYRNPDPDRKLRVGYVSADLRFTSAAMSFAPMLLNYDREHFEVVCYSNSVHEDHFTAKIRSATAGFHVVAGMSDESMARLIASHDIDLLVDLSGHMAGNRLGAFVHRPAPVQVTGWGYANGTGMPQMDYLVADAAYLPDEDLAHFAEKRLDAPGVVAYHPMDTLPEVAPAPILTKGAITFGSFSRLQKLTEVTINLWSRILHAIPESTLLLKASHATDAQSLQRVRGRFEEHGVAPARVIFLPRSNWNDHMQSFAQIDLQLDPFPHGGGISLLDGIAMGVPTLTLRGHTPAARLGASLLGSLNLTDGWIATSEEDYIAQAVRWSKDAQSLSHLRSALRPRLMQSALGDTQAYVRTVEAGYRAAWHKRCESLREERARKVKIIEKALSIGRAKDELTGIECLLKHEPANSQTLSLAGVAAMQMRQPELAIELLERSVQLDRSNPDTWTNLGAAYTQGHREDRALEASRQAVSLRPDFVPGLYNLGCILLQLGRLQEAREIFQETVRHDPNHASAYNNLGIVFERLHDPEQAFQMFGAVVRADPRNPLGHANLGRLCVEKEAFREAIEHFERALRLDFTAHWIRYELAVWYDRLGFHDRMPSLLQEKFNPSSAPATHGSNAGDDHRIMQQLTELIRIYHRRIGIDYSGISEELLRLGGRLMEVDHAAKNAVFQQVIDLDPNNPTGYLQAGISYHHDADYTHAAQKWVEGLRVRDHLATDAGLIDLPHRVLDTTWYMAVGHLQMLDIYEKSVRLGIRSRRDLWLARTVSNKVPNEHYLHYWKEWVHTDVPMRGTSNIDVIAEKIGIPAHQIPLITDHFFADRVPDVHELWHMDFASQVQRRWEASGQGALIKVNADDAQYGRDLLRQMGMPEDAWFVALHVREPGFWGKWDRYHPSIRNGMIDSYAQAIDHIVERGGWVVRMGDKTMRPMGNLHHVIDYAHSPLKNERMDVFLCGSARCFVGVNSGLSLVPPTFGVPCLLTNFLPISIPFPYGRDRMLPKLFRSRESGRLLSVDELFEHGVAHAQFRKHVPEWMELLDNTPEDILSGVREMLDESENIISADEQQRFAALRARYDETLQHRGNFLGTPVAGRFLERYPELLEPMRK